MTPIRRARVVNISVAMIGAIVSGALVRYAASPDALLTWDNFASWVVSPYFALLLPIAFASTIVSQRVILVLSSLLVVAATLLYCDAMFWHLDAQGGLVFLFTPLWQHVAVGAILLGVLVARLRAAVRVENTTAMPAGPSV